MLRTIKGCEFYARCLIENVDGRLHFIVNTRRVGNQTHSLALQQLEVLGFEHFDTGFDAYLGRTHGQKADAKHQTTEQQLFSLHIIFS